jgi:hypothetical protein
LQRCTKQQDGPYGERASYIMPLQLALFGFFAINAFSTTQTGLD